MSEALRPEQRHDEVDEEKAGDEQGDPVERAHGVGSVSSHTAISPIVRISITRTSAIQKKSMGWAPFLRRHSTPQERQGGVGRCVRHIKVASRKRAPLHEAVATAVLRL